MQRLTANAEGGDPVAKLSAGLWKLIDVVLVALMASMFVMVFLNVILRYCFSSSILFSEEASRFSFVWLVFLGAICAVRNNAHVGVDTLVEIAGPKLRRFLMVIGEVAVISCSILLVIGTWRSLPIFATESAPITGIAYIWVKGIALVSGAAMAVVSAFRLVAIVSVPDEGLVAYRLPNDTARNGE
jgi:TRAP-type transport system small permease protein